MAHATSTPREPSVSVLRGPWGVYAGALVLTGLAYLCGLGGLGAGQALGAIAGLIAAGSAVAWRLQTAGDSLDERIESAALVFLAGLLAEVVLHTVGQPWDAARIFLRVLGCVGVAGALLILLPNLGRRVAVSFLVLFHFGGIFCAVTAVEPPGAPAPWLALQAWTRVYRPYLGFMYLNNAYHFYSPEPGPPTLIWFRMQYEDDTFRWVKIPVRKESPVPLHYQRMLALTESINMINPNPMTRPDFSEKLRRRNLAGNIHNIPLHPMRDASVQYREPTFYSKQMLASYARFAFRHFKHLENPATKVTGVKIYRVVHNIILPSDLTAGYHPLDKTLYDAYFQGEYDGEGELKDKEDPFLFWLLPIFSEEIVQLAGQRPRPAGSGPNPNSKIIDCLEIHAGGAPTNALDEKIQ